MILECLEQRATTAPDAVAFTYLRDGEALEAQITWRHLDQRARELAASLRASGAPGERALLLFRPGIDYIIGVFGCLYAGMIAVPASPGNPSRPRRTLARLQALAGDCAPAFVITTSDLLGRKSAISSVPALASARCIAVDTIDPATADAFAAWGGLDPGTTALLQYTSGSTGSPKGVVLSHRNLSENAKTITAAFALTPADRVVTWLPPHHDMGLIGGILQAVFVGFSVTMMAPLHFLERPDRWVRAVNRVRATVTGGPNFAYDLCSRKTAPDLINQLDLSCWRVAFNGSEPVVAATMERFCRRFRDSGFRPEAFVPCYGLAEATLIVTAGPLATTPSVNRDDGRVSSGRPADGTRVVIVDPDTRRIVPAGATGEIWIRGPGVGSGYWANGHETDRVFGAMTSGPVTSGPFLRSGDLGYVGAGELHVCGRLKDVIVVRGRNVHAEDVEMAAAGSHPSLRAGGAAAFAVDCEGVERIVLVHEVERSFASEDLRPVLAAIREAVADAVGVSLSVILLVRAGTVFTTSSGKVQRHACRDAYVQGRLEVIAADDTTIASAKTDASPIAQDARAIERFLLATIASQTGAAVDPDTTLCSIGLDSLAAAELSCVIQDRFGVLIPVTLLLGRVTARRVVDEIEQRRARALDAPPPLSINRESPSLTAAQRALWFLHRLAPTSAAHNVSVALRLRGAVAATALERALHTIAVRHEVLRTLYTAEDGEVMARVAAIPETLLTTVDVSELDDCARRSRVRDDARRPFDLERHIPFRGWLYTFAPDDHVLLLVWHHIAVDLSSVHLLLDEIEQLLDEAEPDRAHLRVAPQLREFAAAEASLLERDEVALRTYWRDRLRGHLPKLELPADRPRPRARSYEGGTVRFELGPECVARIRSLAREHGTTPYVVTFAAFQTFLHRTTRQTALVVGTPLSERRRSAWQSLIGCLVNPVPIRIEVDPESSFLDVVDSTRHAVLGAMDHGDLPFASVVQELTHELRDADRSPVFQVMFAYEAVHRDRPLDAVVLGCPGASARWAGVTVESYPFDRGVAQFDLLLSLAEVGSGLAGSLEYNADVVEERTATQWARQYARLLEEVGRDATQRVDAIELAGVEERAAVIAWGTGRREALPAARVDALIWASAERTPTRVAVCDATSAVTYAQLIARAEAVAAALRAQGVGRETRVGVSVERTPCLVAGLLGVLRAGGVYVPLDVTYPAERVRRMAAEAGVRVLLTSAGLREQVTSAGVPVVTIEEAGETAGRTVPPPAGGASDLAYVMFTSGSTGQPKAVGIEHRGVVAMLVWAGQSYTAAELGGVLATTSINFDLSVFELFAPLAWGGLVLLTADALAVGQLPAALAQRARLLNTVPSAARELLRIGGVPATVRTVNLAGEALDADLVARLAAQGVERIYNLYGPTEDTTYSTVARVVAGERPTIGRPLPNRTVYVLDTACRPVPPGVVGEIYVGGSGVGRGYLNDTALTAARFGPDPVDGNSVRLYRTGDLGRWRADGQLDYLGRCDAQVKVRGYRIELTEIEAVLRQQPGVHDAVVTVAAGADGDARLVAHVVMESAEAIDEAALATAVRQQLPAHQVPSRYQRLERVPRTATGKIDRRALPALRAPEAAAASARTPLEALLAAQCAELLGRTSIGVEDDFFALGGHSLLATRLLARLRQCLGLDLPLRLLFDHPSVATLAAAIRQREAQPGQLEETARIVLDVMAMTPDETRQQLTRNLADVAS